MVRDVDLLKSHIQHLTEPSAGAVLIVVSGLPGTGKSYFSRRLAARVPVTFVESDAMRKVLAPSPSFDGRENGRLFTACHALLEDLLTGGVSVLFDATNLRERNRKRLYNIADKAKAKLVLVQIEAPLEIVSQRLKQRLENPSPDDNSTADITVYRRMAPTAQPIPRKHFAVDTSHDIAPAIQQIAMEIERWTVV